MSTGAAGSLAAVLDGASPDVRAILARTLDGHELSVGDALALSETRGRDLQALTLAPDVAGQVRQYVGRKRARLRHQNERVFATRGELGPLRVV